MTKCGVCKSDISGCGGNHTSVDVKCGVCKGDLKLCGGNHLHDHVKSSPSKAAEELSKVSVSNLQELKTQLPTKTKVKSDTKVKK